MASPSGHNFLGGFMNFRLLIKTSASPKKYWVEQSELPILMSMGVYYTVLARVEISGNVVTLFAPPARNPQTKDAVIVPFRRAG